MKGIIVFAILIALLAQVSLADHYCFGKLNTLYHAACSGRGSCQSSNNCECQSGYRGKDCSEFNPTCFGMKKDSKAVCSGKGQCVGDNICKCEPGFYGENCQAKAHMCFGVYSNNATVCSGVGYCSITDSCMCPKPYEGVNCQIYNPPQGELACNGVKASNRSVCSGGGECIKAYENYCLCYPGFSGNNCEHYTPIKVKKRQDPVCYGKLYNDTDVCSGNGWCQEGNYCHCGAGWKGWNCATPDDTVTCGSYERDHPMVCHGNGICKSNGRCECVNGAYGHLCMFQDEGWNQTCYGYRSDERNVCSGHGVCDSKDSCLCHHGYVGSECQVQLFPHSNYTRDDDSYYNRTEPYYPSSSKCYGISRWNYTAVCNGNGKCLGNDWCDCDSDYIGSECQWYNPRPTNISTCYGIRADNWTVCGGNGRCVASDFCDCDADFTGSECNVWNPYQSNITCFGIPQNNYSTVCSGNGVCSAQDHCYCKSGYSGYNCDVKLPPTPAYCNGVSANNQSVCSGHGNCTDTFWGYHCDCDYPYYGYNCQNSYERNSTLQCHGIPASDPKVCGGHGRCVGDEYSYSEYSYCVCDDNWSGYNCSRHYKPHYDNKTCNGVPSWSYNVCSGHGICRGNSHYAWCDCQRDYTGYDCQRYDPPIPHNETFKCYGIPASDPYVCSHNGECVQNQYGQSYCCCRKGYNGTFCESRYEEKIHPQTWYCNGYAFYDENVCSGSGVCLKPKYNETWSMSPYCVCRKGFGGYNCQWNYRDDDKRPSPLHKLKKFGSGIKKSVNPEFAQRMQQLQQAKAKLVQEKKSIGAAEHEIMLKDMNLKMEEETLRANEFAFQRYVQDTVEELNMVRQSLLQNEDDIVPQEQFEVMALQNQAMKQEIQMLRMRLAQQERIIEEQQQGF